MKPQTIYSATEARQNFFTLLKTVQKGQEVIIVKNDDRTRFKLSLVTKKPKKNLMKIVERMGEIGLETGPWQEMKKIILTKSDIKLNHRS